MLADGDNVQCQWYFINFCIDIVGIACFTYLFLKITRKALLKRGINIELGNYGIEAARTDNNFEITR
jgi:hypothetical protein